MQHTKPLDSCFDLVRSHQQCIQKSPPQEVKKETREYRAKTLPLNYRSTSLTSDAKLTCQCKCAAN